MATLPAHWALSANWTSGRAPGDAMVFRNAPPTRLAGGWALAAGTFRHESRSQALPPGRDWHVVSILRFFDKLELRGQ